MRRRTLFNIGKTVKPLNSVAGDVCLYDKVNNKLIISHLSDLDTYNTENYSPVGIVVVPGTHDVYGDGSCGVVSLVDMSNDTPDTGTIEEKQMVFGCNTVEITITDNFSKLYYIGGGENVNNNEIKGSTSDTSHFSAYIPSDKFNHLQCPHDTDAYYDRSEYYINQMASPYLTNETRNTVYYQTTSPSTTENAMSDFNGFDNTNKILTMVKYPSDWKTSETIINSVSSGYYPSVCCCWRYHTDGTKQGDWYLPAIGELGYIMVKFNLINNAFNLLMEKYDIKMKKITEDYHWSSTKWDTKRIYQIDFNSSYIHYQDLNYNNYVRAFLRVK